MNNKAAGTRLEKEFAEILAGHWFWVHLFQDNKNGQPCDVVAARDGYTYLFDCKDCQEDIFPLSRIEENQYNAMHLFDLLGNGKGMFVIRFREQEIFLVKYDRLRQLQEAGFKRITKSVCRTQGISLNQWLDQFEERGGSNADRDRV